MVRAQITGSTTGTGLLGLGIAIVVVAGSIGPAQQRFNRSKASQLTLRLQMDPIAGTLVAGRT